MKDVIVVPAYERPEYTRVTLEYIHRARGIEDKDIWLFLDNHLGDDFGKIYDDQRSNFGLASYGFCQLPEDTYGNSRNLILALKAAYESGAERIFLIEDDIIVAPDIFEWHEAILNEVNPFVSCATSLNRSAHFQINGPNAMDESIKDPNAYKKVFGAYSSHAVAFTRENLGVLLIRIDSALEWGDWRPGKEQDILIQNIMSSIYFPNAGSAWPYVPRAFNVGIYSYHINTGMKFNGTLEEKCAALRRTITDPDKLRIMSANNRAITAVPAEFVERTGPLVKR